MGYPNLEAEMARAGLTGKDVAKSIGVSRGTLSAWMNGADAAFPIKKAKEARDALFPGQSIDYLFTESPTGAN